LEKPNGKLKEISKNPKGTKTSRKQSEGSQKVVMEVRKGKTRVGKTKNIEKRLWKSDYPMKS